MYHHLPRDQTMRSYLMDELWQPIDGYQGLYEVSNLGKVRSLDRVYWKTNRWGQTAPVQAKGRILRPSHAGARYVSVVLSREGKVKTKYVHHLVAFAFIGERPDGMDINHKDCDKENNQATNLEFVSHRENQRHAAKNGRMTNDNWKRRQRNSLGHFC